MKKSPYFNSKVYLLSVMFYFVLLEIIWLIFDWRDFKTLHTFYGDPVLIRNFVLEMADHLSRHWQNELLTLVYKGAAFVIIIAAGDRIIADNRESSVKLLNTLLPAVDSQNLK